jgi:uncharacterized sulfatase
MRRSPNILLFVTDQQRADTMPLEAPPVLRTPHLHWLSERSTRFSNAFCTSPICTPARGSILTGRYPHETGVVANYAAGSHDMAVPDDVPFLADYLKEAGYVCGYSGKWHLPTGSDRRGFTDFAERLTHWDVDSEDTDEAVAFGRRVGVEMGPAYTTYLNDAPDAPQRGGATKLPLAFHPATLMAQRAAAFLRRMADASDPFCLVYSCIEPHPLGRVYNISPCPFDRMYDPAQMPLPASRRDPGAPAIVRRRNYHGLLPTDDYTDSELQALTAGYFGAVSYVDHLLGILLEALLSTDQFDDTLVVFTSDHGEMMGHHRMLKKGPVMFDDLVRIPLLIKPPRAGAPRAEQGLVSHMDLVPTALSYAGLPAPAALAGLDLRPCIEGGAAPARAGVSIQYHSTAWGDAGWPLRAWRTRDWKFVDARDGDDELYNLRDDPGELRNLAGDPTYADVEDELRAALYGAGAAVADPWPDVPMPDAPRQRHAGRWAELSARMATDR